MAEITIHSPDTQVAAAEQAPLVARANALEVRSKPEHELALLAIRDIAGAEKKVRSLFDEPKKAAHNAHRAICDAESKLLAPLAEARRVIDGKCTVYEREERRKAEEEERRLQELARKQEEERRLQDAIEAEEAGDAQLAEQIIAETAPPPMVTVQPQVAKVAGISTRTLWRAEVTDRLALVRYVAAHPEWIGLVEPNHPALNTLARSQQKALAIPGVVAVDETVRAASGR